MGWWGQYIEIKKVSEKQSFELCLNEIEINELVEYILLHKNTPSNEKNEVYKLAERSNVQIREIDFENIYLL